MHISTVVYVYVTVHVSVVIYVSFVIYISIPLSILEERSLQTESKALIGGSLLRVNDWGETTTAQL